MSISDSNPDKTVILLLAAGLSRRMGRLKQLLPLGNTTILGVTLDNILAARVGGVIVVVGAGSSQTRLIAEQAGIKVVENPFYRQGMSTSLSAGLQAADPSCNMVMVALADQPLIRPETYRWLADAAASSPKGISLPVYHKERGNPIIFKRSYLQELAALKGDVGGRELLKVHADDILEVEVNDAGVVTNINTLSDYEKIKALFIKGGNRIAQEG